MNGPIGFVTAVTPCSLTSIFKLYSAQKIRFSRWIYGKQVVCLGMAGVIVGGGRALVCVSLVALLANH